MTSAARVRSKPARPGSRPAAPPVKPVLTHREILTILGGLLLGMFLSALDQTIVATAMRTIADDLNDFQLQAWATTAFLITATITTPLYGKLSDIYGRRPFILFAIGTFIVGSALCGLSQDMVQLAMFRALQGVGAGGLMSLALAIIGDIVPPRERARYQGYFLAVFGTASVIGPILGGFFAGADTILGVAGWRWIFYINVPVALIALVVIGKFLRIPHTRVDHRIDWPGAIALVAGLVPLLVIAEQGREWGWGSGRSLLCYAIGALGLAAFILIERWYGDEALLPLRLFRGRTFIVGSAGSFILGMAMFGGLLTLPLYLQIVKDSSPTVGGLQLIPFVVGIMIGSIVSGQIISKTGRYRIFPIVGSSLMLAALVLFSLIGADTPLWQTMLVMLLMGLGLGGNMQPVILAVQNAASPREIGVSTASVTFFRSMGGTLGAALFLSILFAQVPDKIKAALADASATPEFGAALAANPGDARVLGELQASGGAATLDDTSFINRLNEVIAHPFKVGFSDAMSSVFLIAAAIMLIGVVLVFLLPELPLRQHSAAQERVDEDAAAADARLARDRSVASKGQPAAGKPGTGGAGAAKAGAGHGRTPAKAGAGRSGGGRKPKRRR